VKHKTCTIQIHLTWMNQSWSLPSLNFVSADLTWLDMYIWLPILNPCLVNGETWYNLNNWCIRLINIRNLPNKSNHKWLQMSWCVQNSLKEFPKKRFRTTVGLSMDMKYAFEAGYNWTSLTSCDKVIASWLRYKKNVFGTQCPQSQ